jgi:hypothetical protein
MYAAKIDTAKGHNFAIFLSEMIGFTFSFLGLTLILNPEKRVLLEAPSALVALAKAVSGSVLTWC